MGDPFKDAISSLLDDNTAISGVAFTDYDGADIALVPADQREHLRTCAVYTGIAIRRLSSIEALHGRGQIEAVSLAGTDSVVVALRVGADWQLIISAAKGTPPAQLRALAQPAIGALESQL